MRADRVMAPEGSNRIDLGAPLRSALRLPCHNSDLKSGPIRHPGAVPFVWEQSPGRPKSVRTRRPAPPSPAPSSHHHPRPSEDEGAGGATPYHDALGDRDPAPLYNPVAAAVPRNGAAGRKVQWEEAEPKIEPKAPAEVLSVADVLRDKEEDAGDDEERFSDAQDTLSRTESFTVNCSVSGLSGVQDRPAAATTASPTEPEARGFMMDRFLPAAQAVAVGSPQYTFRKAGATATGSSAREHAHAPSWRTGGDDDRARRTPVQLPYQHLPPNYLSCNHPRRQERVEEDEEEDDDDDCDVQSTRGFASKGCGLLPGLCVKTSLLLLNPVPAMKNGKARGRRTDRGLPSKGRGQNAPSPLARSSQNKNLGCDSNGVSRCFILLIQSYFVFS
jgi:hypothetical protein